MVLDGAMATELEKLGYKMDPLLWSAKALLDGQDLIKQVHLNYLRAGADIISTCTYQASVMGFESIGTDSETAHLLIAQSINLARSAIEMSGQEAKVAASISSWGAIKAMGQEYNGLYEASSFEVYYSNLISALKGGKPDLFLLETMPRLDEAMCALKYLEDQACYVSFSLNNHNQTSFGDELSEVARALDVLPQVEAIGVNCCHPLMVEPALRELSKRSDKAKICYPNSGEIYEGASKVWKGVGSLEPSLIDSWYDAGARIIGGCCRTGPLWTSELRNWASKKVYS